MKQVKSENSNRNVSLDLLRIISMLMVLTLHYLGKGGLLYKSNVGEVNFIIFYILETLSIVAVNCYVLISGYFLVKSEFKPKKVLKLWIEVVFYSITVYILVVISGFRHFSIKEAILSCFPIITKQYWFITTYMALYILSPFINKLIYALTQVEYKKLLVTVLIIFCLFNILPSKMLLDNTGGCGIIWFICLYLIAGYIRLYIEEDKINIHKTKYIIIYCITAIITTVGILIVKYISENLNCQDFSGKLLVYNMPLILIESICLFLFFNSIEIKNKKLQNIILFIAPLTFSVYIIHEQPTLVKVLYTDILHTEICYHNPYAIVIMFGSVLLVFTICIYIEYARKKIIKIIRKRLTKI